MTKVSPGLAFGPLPRSESGVAELNAPSLSDGVYISVVKAVVVVLPFVPVTAMTTFGANANATSIR